MLAALRLQFTRRGLPGGRSGVLTLLKTNPAMRELLAAEGCARAQAARHTGAVEPQAAGAGIMAWGLI